MGIKLEDLPESYQRQAVRKVLEAERERRERRRDCPEADAASQRPTDKTEDVKPGKYRNIPDRRVSAAGHEIRFDSRKEARRYDELTARLRAGEIRDLRLQVEFTIQEAFTDADGDRIRSIRYVADFTYWEGERYVVEDVKSPGTRTEKYKLKRKLMKDKFGIDIQEA